MSNSDGGDFGAADFDNWNIGGPFEGYPGGTYAFTLSNGAVTAVQAVNGSHSLNLMLPNNATFAVGTGVITETLTDTHGSSTITYAAEAANPNLYQVSREVETVSAPSVTTPNGGTHGLSFTITNGVVTAEQVTSTEGTASHTANLAIPAEAQFSVSAGTVVETLVQGNAVETLTYVQPTGQSLYALASEQSTFIAQGTATTALDVAPGERDTFTFGAGVTVTAAEHLNADGSTSAITLGGHISFTQLASGLVEEVDTFGSHSSSEVFATGPGANGVYTEIAHGAGATVDVVGLEAQLAHLPAYFTNLI